MASYYYLLSSLPMLKADGELPITYPDFLKMCRSSVSDAKYTLLESLTLSSDKGPLVSEWAVFYKALMRELKTYRNRKLDKQPQTGGTENETLLKAVTDAVSGKNPLDAEKALISLEMKKLDELIGLHYFDDHALIGYALKLKLLERKNIFDQKKGKTEMTRILDGLQKQILIGKQE